MIDHLSFNILNGHDYWLPFILDTNSHVNTLVFDAVAPGGDICRTNNSCAKKVSESFAVECLGEKNHCTYWFSFDCQTGWVSFDKGNDTSLSKALLKWQDPSPLQNLKCVGLSNYNYKIDYYNIRVVSNTLVSSPIPRRLLPLFIDAENLVKATFPDISALSSSQLSQVRLLAAWLKVSNTQKQLTLCTGQYASQTMRLSFSTSSIFALEICN